MPNSHGLRVTCNSIVSRGLGDNRKGDENRRKKGLQRFAALLLNFAALSSLREVAVGCTPKQRPRPRICQARELLEVHGLSRISSLGARSRDADCRLFPDHASPSPILCIPFF